VGLLLATTAGPVSSLLAGKVLKHMNGKEILEHVSDLKPVHDEQILQFCEWLFL